MDEYKDAIIADLRRDLRAALREVDAARAEALHQATLCMQLTGLLCKEDMAIEAAEIVGMEAVEAVQKCIGKDEYDDSGD
jgi:predicted DNA-binding protein (UPF0278 family)